MEKENYSHSEKKIIGIYKISNIITNKLYIGSSSFVQARLRQHKSHLLLNKHCNKHLQSSFNKYGLENFNFELIEECILENVIVREQYYIDTLETCNREKGYNKRLIADSNNGLKRSDEARKNISNGKKGKRYLPDEHYQKLKEQLTGTTNYGSIEYQKSLTSEQKTKNAYRALEGRKIKELERGSHNTEAGEISYKKKRGHPVYQYDINSKLINTFLCTADALRYLGMSSKNTSCITNQINTGKIYKNFIWESVERINSNINNEFGELLENLEVDNQQPSINLKD